MKPTFLRVGVPKNTVRPPTTIRPPTEVTAASTTTDVECNTNNSTTTTPAWDLPIANAVTGDMLAAYIYVSGSQTLTTPTGWTLADSQSDGGTVTGYLIYREVDGTETTPTTYTVSGLNPTIAQTWLIRANGSTFVAPTVAMSFQVGGTANPPAVSPAAGNYLVYAGASINTTSWAGTDAPTNYTHLETCTLSTQAESSVTYRTVAITSSEDPSAFGNAVSGTRRIVQWTMAFQSDAGAAPLATGDHTHTLASGDFTDVDVTGVTVGDMLRFDGTDWVPA